jgi:hypothetical protein
MSKLLEHLQITNTNERRYVPKPLKMVTGTLTSEDMYLQDYATVYTVEARLGARVVVSDTEKLAVGADSIIKQKVYRPLAEEVFGEFRQPLIDADLAIAQGEYKQASDLIREVLYSMFKV